MLMHTSSLSSDYPDHMQTRIWLGKGKDPIQANHARRITVYNEEDETLFTLPCISCEVGSQSTYPESVVFGIESC